LEESLSVDVQGERRIGPPPRRRLPLTTILSVVVGLVGVAALGASAWVYAETRREIVRLSTDIAQLRVSLELYGRQQGMPAGETTDLSDLANRLAILEQNWRDQPSGETTGALPPLPPPEASGQGTDDVASGDCLPTGTRFMVAAGDLYPVCGTGAVVEIGSVDDGFISLGDGTVIAQGGTIALPDSACMIGVLPAEGAAVSGFAEIRVTC